MPFIITLAFPVMKRIQEDALDLDDAPDAKKMRVDAAPRPSELEEGLEILGDSLGELEIAVRRYKEVMRACRDLVVEHPRVNPRPIDKPWWFITTDEHDMGYVYEWTPPNTQAAASIDAIFKECADKADGTPDATTRFSVILNWLLDAETEESMPDLLKRSGLPRSSYGTFTLLHDGIGLGGLFRETSAGPTYWFDSWC